MKLVKRIIHAIKRRLHRPPPQTSIAERLVKQGVFAEEPLKVLDVGCSGGIAPWWRVFEPSLHVLAVDPLVDEITRLRAAESNPHVTYENAFVGLPADHPFAIEQGNHDPNGANPWDRLSAGWADKLLRADVPPQDRLSVLNDWKNSALVSSGGTISVDQLAGRQGFEALDFIKIDVDGDDLNVLLSAEQTVRSSPVLGLMLEVNFYGSDSKFDHTFHNTDRLMREWGFELFDLTIRRYSNAALPGPFVARTPSETQFGRPYQGDAVYLRDPLGRHATRESKCPQLSPIQLLKLACLFQIFGLPDHSAELIKTLDPAFSARVDSDQLLDFLVKSIRPDAGNYQEYLDRFTRDPTKFYPS